MRVLVVASPPQFIEALRALPPLSRVDFFQICFLLISWVQLLFDLFDRLLLLLMFKLIMVLPPFLHPFV